MTPRLCVVLPTYNERNNIRRMIGRIGAALDGIAWEVIIVDDNSPDATADEARAVARECANVRVIQRIGRRGLSSAAIEGMCATVAPIVAVMDADHQHDPALLPQMLSAIESGEYDLAYASRFAAGASVDAWGRPDRVKVSGIANRIANRVTGVDLTDPMSGYFMLRAETLRADAHRLSGIGFKILLDILATVDAPLRVKEVPMNFAAREEGESKLDRTVAFEFLVGLYDKWLGHLIPTRFAIFGTVGLAGAVIHMIVLWLALALFGAEFALGHYPRETPFIVGQTVATFSAMTFNFILNNELTYSDKRLRGAGPLVRGWVKFVMSCAIGALGNIGVSTALVRVGAHPFSAALAGIAFSSVWNYALSSRYVWGKY